MFEGQSQAGLGPGGTKGLHGVYAVAARPVRFDGQAPGCEGVHQPGVGRRQVGPGGAVAHGFIEERPQAPLGDERRVQVAERASRGVARVGKQRFAFGFA